MFSTCLRGFLNSFYVCVYRFSLCVVSHLHGRVLVTCLSLTDLHKLVPNRVSCFHLLSSHPVRTNSRPVHRFTWYIYMVAQKEQLRHEALDVHSQSR
jgi:hypothetical protein